MGKNGVRIDEDDVEFLVIEDDKLPQLKNISTHKAQEDWEWGISIK